MALFFIVLLKGMLFALGGFVVTYIGMITSRWWPTTYVDTRELPKETVRSLNFRFALWGGAAGFLIGVIAEVFK